MSIIFQSCKSFFESSTTAAAPNTSQKNRTLFKIMGLVGAGALVHPGFRVGTIAGVAMSGAAYILATAFSKFNIIKSDPNSSYTKEAREVNPLIPGLIHPIEEELIYRGALQSVVGLIPASLIFGATHLINAHKNAKVQALATIIYGVAFGLLSENYGIAASIAAHVANNTIVLFLHHNDR